ncbi:hypothetical protein ONZ45_g11260 [Pleurotus djamor]|nr:hypothetical protein ONZ45_g11260 [Pleurotus djamor]
MPSIATSSSQVLMNNLSHSSQFWFSDGNVVLVTKSVAFKVHRGQLSRHSEFFDGLFSIPQPSNGPLIAGCQCIKVYDEPSDVAFFLSALYDGLYLSKPSTFDFSRLAGVLRLSTKYCVEHLRDQCLQRLHQDWPSTLRGWDRREHRATDPKTGGYIPRELYPHPIILIELAMELNLPFLFPAAFYDLSRYGPSKIAIGTIAPVVAPVSPQPKFVNPANEIISLPHQLLVATLKGRELGQQYMANFIARELRDRPLSAKCENRGIVSIHHGLSNGEAGRVGLNDCYQSFYFIMLNVLRSMGGMVAGRDADPLYTLNDAIGMLTRKDFSSGEEGSEMCGLEICDSCKAEFEKCAKRARKEVWSLMPSWFGIDGAVWEEVADMEL